MTYHLAKRRLKTGGNAILECESFPPRYNVYITTPSKELVLTTSVEEVAYRAFDHYNSKPYEKFNV
jgi:hypothetical protein